MLEDGTEDYALWAPKTEPAPLRAQHICWPESSAQTVKTLDGVAASADILSVNQRYESVVDRAEGRLLYRALHGEAGHANPRSRASQTKIRGCSVADVLGRSYQSD